MIIGFPLRLVAMSAYDVEQNMSDPVNPNGICIGRNDQNSKFGLNSGKKTEHFTRRRQQFLLLTTTKTDV
jgi:hypothetical protein